jgi:hypothetical protein
VLALVGAIVVVAGLVANLVFVRARSDRYRLSTISMYDSDADVVRLVRDQAWCNAIVALGAVVQLVAVVWQSVGK